VEQISSSEAGQVSASETSEFHEQGEYISIPEEESNFTNDSEYISDNEEPVEESQLEPEEESIEEVVEVLIEE